MNQYVQLLNFNPNDIIKKSWVPEFDTNKFYINPYDDPATWPVIFEDYFLDIIQCRLKITRLMIFNKPSPWGMTDVHVDTGQTFAFNILPVACPDNKMQWYSPIDTITPTVQQTKGVPTPLYSWPINKVNFLYEANIDGRTAIVRTDIPHRINVKGTQSRMALSLRFKHDFKSWEETVDTFGNWGWLSQIKLRS